MLTKMYVKAGSWLRAKDEGATATEYGLLVAFIAFAIIVAVGFFGDALSNFFGRLTTEVNGWNP